MKLWGYAIVLLLIASSSAVGQPREPAALPDEPPTSEAPAESAESKETPDLTLPSEEPSGEMAPELPEGPPEEMPEESETPGMEEEPAESTEPAKETPESEEEGAEEIAGPTAEEEAAHEGPHEPLWPDYYGPPWSPAYDPGVMLKGGCCACSNFMFPHTWGQFDVLLWWTKGEHLPPLVTTSPVGTPIGSAGTLGASTTEILFGQQTVNNTIRAGGRMNIGLWLDPEENIGIGASLLGLARDVAHFSRDSSGSPILARPFFNVSTGQQDSEIVAYPGVAAGGIRDRATSNFMATDVYVREALRRSCNRRLDMLVGYRFVGLDEGLQLDDLTISTNQASIIPLGTAILGRESFLARSQFNGPMMGLWYQSRANVWGLDILGKLALGDVHQIIYAFGGNAVTVPGQTSVITPGSLLVQGSNLGRIHRDQFGVLPEIQLNLTRYFGENWMFRIGYTFLYLNNVAQVGRQIDLAVNPTQIGGGTLVGAARPALQFHRTDYVAQGINLGFEFRY